mmetsp:Transcript_43011/g.135906  ORF Transcript_43011/g.135906 Transcript_43011/m.135906 type:complete len:402 (+) Transcript_43011:42-1247(+)
MAEEQLRAGANAYLWEDAAGASLAHAASASPASSAPTPATAGCSPCSSSHASWMGSQGMGSQGMGSQGSASAGSYGPRAPAAYPLSYASADLPAVGDGGSGRLNARRWPVESPRPAACGGAPPLGAYSMGQVQELLAEQQSKNIELIAQLYEARQHTPAGSGSWPPSAPPHAPPPPPVPPVLPLQPAQGPPLPGPLPAPLSALPYPYGIGAAGWEAEARAEAARAEAARGAQQQQRHQPPPPPPQQQQQQQHRQQQQQAQQQQAEEQEAEGGTPPRCKTRAALRSRWPSAPPLRCTRSSSSGWPTCPPRPPSTCKSSAASGRSLSCWSPPGSDSGWPPSPPGSRPGAPQPPPLSPSSSSPRTPPTHSPAAGEWRIALTSRSSTPLGARCCALCRTRGACCC